MSEEIDWITTLTEFAKEIGSYVESKSEFITDKAELAFDKVVEGFSHHVGQSSAKKVAEFWSQLRTKLQQKKASAGTLADIAEDPEDDDAIEDLKTQIARLIKRDEALFDQLKQLYQQANETITTSDHSIHEIGELSYSFLVTGNHNQLHQINQPIDQSNAHQPTGAVQVDSGSYYDQRGSTFHQMVSQGSDQNAITDTGDPLQDYRTWLSNYCTDLPLKRLLEIEIRDENTLHSLYVPLEAYETAREKDPIEFRRRFLEGEYDNKVELIDLVEREQRWVLLGEPGAGKSTFARHLAKALTTGEFDLPTALQGLFPVFIELRNIVRFWPEEIQQASPATFWQAFERDLAERLASESLAESIRQALQSSTQLEQIWLLDGLDEVTAGADRRESLCRTIEELISPQRRILVTARPYAYAESAWQLQGFKVYTLAPFEQAQWSLFIEKYYRGLQHSYGLDPGEADELAQQLTEELNTRQRPQLLRLAERPLLLTLLTHQHALSHGRLPDSRAELYENSVKQLLNQWQVERIKIYRDDKLAAERRMLQMLKTDFTTLRERLQRLAFDCHRQQQRGTRGDHTADISREQLIGMFYPLISEGKGYKPEDIVDYLADHASLLYARDKNTFAMAHRTFQEYLSACHLIGTGLLQERWELLQHIDGDLVWWREVILLAFGKLRLQGPNPTLNAIGQLLPYDIDDSATTEWDDQDGYAALLAGYALSEFKQQGEISDQRHFNSLNKRCIGWLRYLLEQGHLPPPARAEAGDVLGMLGDPRPGVRTVTTDQGELPAMAFAYVPGMEDFCLGYTVDELRNWDKERLGFEPDEEEHWPEGQPGLAIPAFWMAAYPVTVSQFKPFVDAKAYENKEYWTDSGEDWLKNSKQTAPIDWKEQLEFPNRPVIWVTWYEAVAYCNWLNTKLEALLGKNRIKIFLPSEYEWEWAARGPERRHYPWGETWQDGYANVEEAAINRACTVGIFPGGINWSAATSRSLPDLFVKSDRVFDLTGNVWEWCRTRWQGSYKNYRINKKVWDGRYLRGDDTRVVRGNAYYNNGLAARGALRSGSPPWLRLDFRGFRCCAHVSSEG